MVENFIEYFEDESMNGGPFLPLTSVSENELSLGQNDSLIDRLGLDPVCSESFDMIQQALKNMSEKNAWVLQFLDASSKNIPAGLITGWNLFDLGHFDGCQNIDVDVNSINIKGQYCLAKIFPRDVKLSSVPGLTPLQKATIRAALKRFLNNSIPSMIHDFKKSQHLGRLPFVDIPLRLAVCVPSTCNSSDLDILFNNSKGIQFLEEDCYCKDKELPVSASASCAIAFFVFLVLIAIAATIYDIWLYYSGKEPAHKILTAFSVYSNFKSLVKTSGDPEQIQCLQGIRCISMAWVIVGHSFHILQYAPFASVKDIIKWILLTRNIWIIAGVLSVDSFFLISGLLTVYVFFNAADKGVKFNVFQFYLYRYLRLTPMFAALIFFHATLLPYLGSGPMYSAVERNLGQPCAKNWWQGLLYIQTYYYRDHGICLPQSWYLSADFEMYLFTPFVLIPLKKWPKYGVAVLGGFIFGGFISPLIISCVTGIPGAETAITPETGDDYVVYYYNMPYARFGPYVIGMGFGYAITLIKKKTIVIPKLSWWMVLIFWILVLSGLLSCVYCMKEITPESVRAAHVLFITLNRNSWAILLGFLILACLNGYGGPINGALTLPFIQVIGKLCYSMYLVHYTIIYYAYLMRKSTIFLTEFLLFTYIFGFFVMTMVIAIPVTLLLESPMLKIQKTILEKRPKVKFSDHEDDVATA